MKKVKTFFWYCSGANARLLNECPTESSKYVGIGATIFFTGLFAALSAGYAFYTVFDNSYTATLLALVWGLMIFNLDRFIVSSMRKSTPMHEFKMAVPRFILAVLISIVIAKPLELKVFEKEINSELVLMQDEAKAFREQQILTKYEAQLHVPKEELAQLKKEINDKTQKRNELREIARVEADGTGGTKKRNAGPIYNIKKADADRLDNELNELKAKNQPLIDDNIQKIASLDSLQKAELLALENEDIGGPAARMEALTRLGIKSNAIWLANIFIMLLFIVIEISPILVKLMTQKGPYDHLLFTEEYKFETSVYKNRAFIHDELKRESEELAKKEKEYVTSQLDMRLDNA